MYDTVDDLFTGICDAIREKDGTTALISHQDIPERIASIISGDGENGNLSFESSFFTYDGGGMKIKNMVVSEFDYRNAIFLSEPFLPGENPWEIGIKFTWPEQTKASSYFFGAWPTNHQFKCPTACINVSNNVTKIVATVPNGSYGWQKTGNYQIEDAIIGKNYWMQFIFDGEKYIVKLSPDGKNFEDIIQIEYGVMYQDETNSKLQFGGFQRTASNYFEGSIDLKETYIKINGEIWWGRR